MQGVLLTNLHHKRGPAGGSCLPVLKALSPEGRSRTSERPAPRGPGREHSAVGHSQPSQRISEPAGVEDARRLQHVRSAVGSFVENQPATFSEGTTVEYRSARTAEGGDSLERRDITGPGSGHSVPSDAGVKIAPSRQSAAGDATWGGGGGAGVARAHGRAGLVGAGGGAVPHPATSPLRLLSPPLPWKMFDLPLQRGGFARSPGFDVISHNMLEGGPPQTAPRWGWHGVGSGPS